MKVIVFGAGRYGRDYISFCAGCDTIVAIADNYNDDPFILGHKIIKPNEILNYDFDKVLICLRDNTREHQEIIIQIYKQLIDMGIPRQKIILNNIREERQQMYIPRTIFMKNITEQIKNVAGDMVECGVLFGNFAALINKLLPEKHLHLFDTFIGFDERDMDKEDEAGKKWLSGAREGHSIGSEFLTLLRCLNYENITIYKGYVPDTLSKLNFNKNKYSFVNLDMDLYAPTLSALNYFSSRIEKGGIILLHDYFCEDIPGIRKAVFEAEDVLSDFIRFPIGDGYSLALMKK